MAYATLDILYRSANVLLGVAALAVAGIVVVELTRRPARGREPLASALVVVFLAIGADAAVRFAYGDLGAGGAVGVLTVLEWVAAGAALTFLALRHRYPLLIESAEAVRAYESGYAEKAREARALAQVNEELRRVDELKSEILAMVSHELRTPLTAIVGYSRLLTRQVHGPLTPKQLEYHEAIFRSAQRLTELINDLLDVARLEGGRIELQPRPTDVRQVVDHVLAVVRVAAQGKRLQVSNEVGDVPHVQADPTRLHQILVNLVGNAVKFTPAGGAVRIQAARHGDQVWIAVQDTGVGIARDELARIWDPFYQVESPMRRRHGGSGLGLAIVRRLVELHGGLVRAESGGEGRGSRFSFTVPVAGETAGPSLAETEGPLERVLAGRDVLIVEDDENNQALMRIVVEDVLGGRARICADGEHAVAEATGRPPALVLLDLMLPDVSGWEVARRLRQHARTRAVPLIAVSALARAQEREAAYHAGCDAYVSKPFTPDALSRVVTATLLGEGAATR
jgi:signal transduction histidine kinase/ActR/RegA family two-component response regulator